MPGGNAPNAQLNGVVDYGPDPRGWSMFHSLSAQLNGFLTHGRSVSDANATHYGWTAAPQSYRGANAVAGRVIAAKNSTFDQENTQTITDPSLRIFADRLQRGLR